MSIVTLPKRKEESDNFSAQTELEQFLKVHESFAILNWLGEKGIDFFTSISSIISGMSGINSVLTRKYTHS